MRKTVRWNRALRQAIYPFDHLNEYLQKETRASDNYLLLGDDQNLQEARLQTDQAILKFRERLERAQKGRFSSVVAYKDRILSQLTQLDKIRAEVTAKTISVEKMNQYFQQIESECFIAIDALNDLYKDHAYYMSRHNAYLYLLKEQFAEQKRNTIMKLAIQKNTVTAEQLEKLCRYEEAIQVYQKDFFTFASDFQKEVYREASLGKSP